MGHSCLRSSVRLVKGAYWDAEIKHAQQQGLDQADAGAEQEEGREEPQDDHYREELDQREAVLGLFAHSNPLSQTSSRLGLLARE